MKKLAIAAMLLLTLLTPQVVLPAHSNAANVFNKACNDRPNSSVCQESKNGSKKNPLINIIAAAIDILSVLTGIAAVIGIMISGLRMILANGNAEAVASARTGLIFSLVGVAVVVLAQSIVAFILDKL